MNKKGFLARAAVGVLGGALLIGGAGAAIAAELDDSDVDVNVTIDPIEPVGALTMSVAPGAAVLTEVESADPALRQFDGTLPTVTVTDDREEVPADEFWYVTGQSSELTSGANTIGAGNIGWTPALLSGDEEQVIAGDEVVTVLDDPTQPGNNVGLVGEELLAMAPNLVGELAPGEWSANADLFLKTPVDVAPGAYSGTITLTLWEDTF